MADADQLLAGLDASQLQAVSSTANPLAIIAGAGSGKTRVLTRRIAHRIATGAIDPERTLAVTFTRKAAAELRERLRSVGTRGNVTTGTFHALAFAQIHERWADRGVRPPEMLDRKFGVIARILGRNADQSMIADVLAELEWITARNISFDQYDFEANRAGRTSPIPTSDLLQVAKRYAEEKRKARMIDFDDLLSLAIRDIEADDEYASVIRWRHRHVFVDEFQDVNPLQFRLLKAWIGDDPDLCVVGDPNQAIYGWNGADSQYLRRFERYFPTGETVRLGWNYRSTPQIVAAGHAVLPRPERELTPPQTDRADGPEPLIRKNEDDEAEAAAIARALRDNNGPGQSWSQQAVLVRTNAQANVVATSLERAGIPHRLRGRASLTEQPEIRQILRSLRQSATPLAQLLGDLRADIDASGGPVDELSVAEADRQRNREVLLQLATDHAASFPTATGADFAGWLTTTGRNDAIDAAGNAVDVMTFHAAKGLEWNVVHLAGIEQGYVPISQAKGPAALSEERRLLHVALTRARDKVIVSWAARRQFGSRSSKRNRSPYLEHLDPTPDERDTKVSDSDQTRARHGVSKLRSELAEKVPDTPLYQELRDWRLQRSKDDGVPAYVVFNNKTLAAIALEQPTSVDELLALPGVGPAKVEKYGEEVLDLIRYR